MHGRRLIVDYQDVRTISATDQSLLTMVRMRQFREDLYCRLHILNLHLPALRDHSDDIPVLTTQLLQAALWRLRSPLNAPAVIEGIEPLLCGYARPGNVRELENVTQRLAVLLSAHAEQPEIDQDELRLTLAEL